MMPGYFNRRNFNPLPGRHLSERGLMNRRQFQELPFSLFEIEGGFCQINYNPQVGDCPWTIAISGNHTPDNQRDLPITALFQTPIRLASSLKVSPNTGSLFYGVRSDLEWANDAYHTIPGTLPEASADCDLEIPIDFNETAENPCVKTASKADTATTGLIDAGFGTAPPATYALTYDNVALYQQPLRADTVGTFTVGSGSDGLGEATTVQVFWNSDAGTNGTDMTAGDALWVRDYQQPIRFDSETFAGGSTELGYLLVSDLGGTGFQLYDTTTLEWSQSLNFNVAAEFRNGVVDVDWTGSSNATARAVLRAYDETSWVLNSGGQGLYTGTFGTTDVSLPNSVGSNFSLGTVGYSATTSSTSLDIFWHPLLTALGIPTTGTRNVRFWVRWLYRPSIEGAYTFTNLNGEPEPDGWAGGAYATGYGSTAIDLVCSLTRNTAERLPVSPPSTLNAGSPSLAHDPASWTGEPDLASKWKNRDGFSFPLNSLDTTDVLTATRNDCGDDPPPPPPV